MRNPELFYTHPASMIDDGGGHWATEQAYFQGLGEDAGESVVMMTPSGQTSAPPSGGGILDSLARSVSAVLPTLASVYQQKKFTDLNIARANQGLQPLSVQQYASAYQVPLAQVQVGPNDQAKKLLMIGGGVLVGLVALRALKVI
jgi:hypothetical protein